MSDSRETPGPLVRIAAIVEYDGTDFLGLQRQARGPTIQGAIEDAARAFGVEDCRFAASGRTDAGVHARGQVVALDLPAHLVGKRKNIVSAINWHLPETIRVRRTALAPEGFDPRRNARRRTYRYLLCAGQPHPPLALRTMGRVRAHLELVPMIAACNVLAEREWDFRAWRSTMCQAKRTRLRLLEARVEPWPDRAPHAQDGQTFALTFACRSFLHRMVRYLVGGVAEAGAGRLGTETLRAHLDEGTLPPGVNPAEARGLSLESVFYPPDKDPFGGE